MRHPNDIGKIRRQVFMERFGLGKQETPMETGFDRSDIIDRFQDEMKQAMREARHWIHRPDFAEGLWKGEDITKLETSHLLNCRDMLLRMEQQYGPGGTMVLALREKRVEINKILKTRTGEIIRRHEIRITTEDLVAWMKSRGVHIPKSGAGVYIGKQKIEECYLRFDTTHKIKERPRARK